MLLCYVIDSGLSTSLLLLATLIIMFYIYITLRAIQATTENIAGREPCQSRRIVTVCLAVPLKYSYLLI